RQFAELEKLAGEHGLNIHSGEPGIASGEVSFAGQFEDRRESVGAYLNHIGVQAISLEAKDIRPLCGAPDNPVSRQMEDYLLHNPDYAEQHLTGLRPQEIQEALNNLARKAVWNRPPTDAERSYLKEGWKGWGTTEDADQEARQAKIDAVKKEIEQAESFHC